MWDVPNTFSSRRWTRAHNPVHVKRHELLRFADFRKLAIGQFASQAVDALGTVLIAQLVFFASPEGPSTKLLMYGVASAAIPLFLAGPISGIVADKFSRHTVLKYGQLCRALICCLMLFMVVNDVPTGVVVLYACGLCASKVLYTVRVSTIRHLVRQHELVAADSFLLIVGNVAASIGGTLGIVLLRFIGLWGLTVVVVGHCLAALMFARIATIVGGGKLHPSISWRHAVGSLGAPKNRYAVVTTGAHRLIFGVMFATNVILADRSNPNAYALLMGAAGLGAFFGNITAEWFNEHLPRRSIAVVTYLISALASFPMLFASLFPVSVTATLIIAFVFQNLRVCSDATIQKNAMRGAGGRVFGLYDLQCNASFLLGLVIGLSLEQRIEPWQVHGSAAGAFLLASLVFNVMSRTHKSLPTTNAEITVHNENSKISWQGL